ncbi:hypothetical protein AK88_05177 [Plasmodium fragile]|uniref:Schizont-infected cell agglutination extracellular alpha domain-containing protein n=1 Tax=Plasmodium fragile TaxID=5857 RepID=A0A0D9QDV9_PLAFR|nr:uncharacterized protein AK88_05177 [Plasmodium fragile]KJP85183.1 hypothetical protein AK88_05177 [Plasmodium fragile]
MQDLLYTEVNNIFDALTRVIGQSNLANSTICGELYFDADTKTCLRRCPAIVSLLLYMRGYEYGAQHWTKSDVETRSAEGFKKYLKCILAKEAIMELYGRSEEHLQIIQEISDTLRNGGTVWTQKYADGICEGQDYGKYIFGSGIMRQSIRNRLKELGKHWVRGGRSPDRTSGKCTWPHAVQMEEEQQNTKSCKDRAKEGKQDEQEIMELMDVDKTQLTTYLKTHTGTRLSPAADTPRNRTRKNTKTSIGRATPPASGATECEERRRRTRCKGRQTSSGETGKTSSSGGGPSGGANTAAGGKEKAPKEIEPEQCLGEKVWEWRPREIYVVQGYSADQWKNVQKVLTDFIEHLSENNEHFDAYGANCDNISWEDMRKGEYHRGQRVSDMMRCRIMSGALWFANEARNRGEQDTEDERRRCEVAHVFGHLLKTQYCKDKTPWPRGVEYAYTVLQKMGKSVNGHNGMNGPVMNKRCTMCGYTGYKHNVQAVDLRIAQWLMKEGGILGELAEMEKKMPCQEYWEKYTQEQVKPQDTMDNILTAQGQVEKQRLDKEVVEKVEQVFNEAKKKTEEWTRVKNVLDAFAEHMQRYEDLMAHVGANCNNAYWEDFTQGQHHAGQRVADMMRCRIMSGALWFANEARNRGEQDTEDERRRCDVAHVFGHLLKTQYCKDKTPWPRGVEYAYKAMRNMGNTVNGTEGLKGPVVDGKCNICGYERSRTTPGIINGDMATWLLVQWRVMDKLTHMERTMDCTKDWAEYQLQPGKAGTITAKDEARKKKLDAVKEEAQETAEDIVKKLQDEVKVVLDDLGNCTAPRDNECVKQLFEKEIQARAGKTTITNTWPHRHIQPHTNTNIRTVPIRYNINTRPERYSYRWHAHG